MRIFSRVLLLILIALGLILAVVLYYTVNPRLPDYVPVEQVRYQDQWSAADRQTYYFTPCLLYTSPSPRDRQKSRMPSSA